MEEKKVQNGQSAQKNADITAQKPAEAIAQEPEQQCLSEELKTLVGDIVLEFKKSGSITTSQLLDKLDKYDAGPNDIEEVYRILETSGIQVINEYERDKDLYDQLLQ